MIPTFLALLLCWPFLANAANELNIPVGKDDVEIPVTRYQGSNAGLPLLLWLPSSRGMRPAQKITANSLADFGYEVWLVDSHSGYFVDVGRRSVDQFPNADMADLIEAAILQSGREVVLMSRGRAAKNVLGASRVYQQRNQQRTSQKNLPMSVIGHILFGPNLRIPPQSPGDSASYLAIAKSVNLPSYIIQPGISTGTWRANEVVEVLRSGGAEVYLQMLPGIQGGFHLRPDEDLTEADFVARADLPFLLERAIKVLKLSPRPSKAATVNAKVAAASGKTTSSNATSSKATSSKARYGIKPLKAYPAVLNLPDITGKAHDIQSHQGRVSLVSFWASWCEPCIRELPSLKRLHDDFKNKGLDIVTVNAGEDAATIKAAADKLDMNAYTLLMDEDGAAVKAWNVYGFPTNFLLNENGEVVYGSFGAVEWDEPEARAAVESMFQ